jgi:hypothetical protein
MENEKSRVTEVSFRRTIPTGSYSTVQVGMVSTVGPDESAEEVIRGLDDRITALFGSGEGEVSQAPQSFQVYEGEF